MIAYPVLPVHSYVHCKRESHNHNDPIKSTQRQSDRDFQAVNAWTIVDALVTPDATASAFEAIVVRVRFSSKLAIMFELDEGSVKRF